MPNPVLRSLLEHNTWATRVLLRACAALNQEQFHQRFDIGPGSLHDALRHIVGAMLRWADRIARRELRPSIDEGPRLTVDEMLELLGRAHDDLVEIAERVQASGELTHPIEFRMPEGISYHFSKATSLVHVATHGMHHRAQVLNMLRRLGCPPLGLDLDTVEWECVLTGQIEHPLA